MCGFVGLISRRGIDERSRRAVEGAAASIRHRGPDSEGSISTSFAHIAFRRLAVVDVAGGQQPLANEDDTVKVFLNGEIFNHEELRHGLTQRGHVLRTRSDTEVLPHLWEEHGPQMLCELNGMFAVCIVDNNRSEVFIARDRLGIKPMFIARTPQGTVFGSELKAVLATGLAPRDFAREAAVRFIDTLSVGGRSTLIRGVSRLLPGEALHATPDGERTFRWYDLAAELRAQPSVPDKGEVLALLLDSVDLRLNADVPVGISLSGGVDSTMLALLARDAGHEHVAAFTADFDEVPREEIESARAVADALGLRHEVCSATTADFVREAPFAIWSSDEPIADPAFYPALKIAEAASRSVTVLLSGTGADELFAGYGHHRLTPKRALAAQGMAVFPAAIPARLARYLGADPDEAGALAAYPSSRLEWHTRAMTHLTSTERAALMRHVMGCLDPTARLRDAFAAAPGPTELGEQLFADTVTYLPDQLLPLLDRTTMAHSVEGRVPFLDHRVVEAALRLGDGAKLGPAGTTKRLLRQTLRGRVPDIVLDRPKLGFPNAVQSWLRGELGDLIPAMLDHPDGVLRAMFPGPWLEALLLDREQRLARWPVTYALLTLEIWHRLVVVDGLMEPPHAPLTELYPLRTPPLVR